MASIVSQMNTLLINLSLPPQEPPDNHTGSLILCWLASRCSAVPRLVEPRQGRARLWSERAYPHGCSRRVREVPHAVKDLGKY